MIYDIYSLIGENCMTPNDGQKIYHKIHPQLVAGRPVELDFSQVKIFASPFFNFAIGQLLRDIQPNELNCLLKVSNLNLVGQQVLKQVIENSKRYYSDDQIREAVDAVMREQAESV